MSETIPNKEATLDPNEFSLRVAVLNLSCNPNETIDSNMFSGSTLIPQNVYNHTEIVSLAKEFLIRTKLFSFAEGPSLETLLINYSDLVKYKPQEDLEALDKVFKDTYLDKYYAILKDIVYDYSMDASALKLRELKNFLNFLVSDSVEEVNYLNDGS